MIDLYPYCCCWLLSVDWLAGNGCQLTGVLLDEVWSQACTSDFYSTVFLLKSPSKVKILPRNVVYP